MQESNNRCLCAYKAAASREQSALRVSFFESDMGELLFSGLTPDLPLMDRPPNSQLLQAHSGAARSKGSPLSFSFGKEMDQPTVCQVHCQGLLQNQTASITLMDTTGVHSALYKHLTLVSQNGSKCDSGKKKTSVRALCCSTEGCVVGKIGQCDQVESPKDK